MCKTIAYLRVSTDKQELDNQKMEIQKYAKSHNLTVDEFVTQTISSRKSTEDRGIDALLSQLKRDDILIVSELSRLARSMREIHNITHALTTKRITTHIIKQALVFKDNDMTSKIVINSFAMAAEIERELISQRTKTGLARAKANGVKLGNPNLKADNAKRTKKANEFAENLRSTITGFIKQKLPQRAIVEELNKVGIKTTRGNKWSLIALQRTMARLDLTTT